MTPAKANQLAGEISDVINIRDILDDILQAIAERLEPDEVFGTDVLEEWAEAHGFTKE